MYKNIWYLFLKGCKKKRKKNMRHRPCIAQLGRIFIIWPYGLTTLL